MDGNAKHDLEHTAEKSVSMSAKISKISTILFGRFLIRANRYYQKHFSSSMKALRKDTSLRYQSAGEMLVDLRNFKITGKEAEKILNNQSL